MGKMVIGGNLSQRFEHLIAHLQEQTRDDEGVRFLADFLQQLLHDLRTPIGVFSLELFSIEGVLSDAQKAVANGEIEKATESINIISDIAQNLLRAQVLAEELIESLDARNASLAGTRADET